MISYQFLLNCLALLSFFITLGCVQKGVKNDSPSEDTKNQIVVETKSTRVILVGSLSLAKTFQKWKLVPNLRACLF